MMKKVAIVTGGSSGLGLETVRALHRAGTIVYEFSRRPEGPAEAVHISCDVSDEASVRAAVEEVVRLEGRVDILINNAGSGLSGSFEFTDTESARRLLDVNLFGMVNTIKAVLPYMRARKRGRIVNVSSLAAPLPIPFQSWYSISKAAVNSLTLSLANELRPFRISVCAVMPGDLRTGFTAARQKLDEGNDIYATRVNRSVAKMEHDEQFGKAAHKSGESIARIAMKRRVRPFYSIGICNKCRAVLGKLLCRKTSQRVLYMLYGR